MQTLTKNMMQNKNIMFKRPQDTEKRNLLTYSAKEANRDERLWLDIATHKQRCIKFLASNIKNRPEQNPVKNVIGFTDRNSKEL